MSCTNYIGGNLIIKSVRGMKKNVLKIFLEWYAKQQYLDGESFPDDPEEAMALHDEIESDLKHPDFASEFHGDASQIVLSYDGSEFFDSVLDWIKELPSEMNKIGLSVRGKLDLELHDTEGTSRWIINPGEIRFHMYDAETYPLRNKPTDALIAVLMERNDIYLSKSEELSFLTLIRSNHIAKSASSNVDKTICDGVSKAISALKKEGEKR